MGLEVIRVYEYVIRCDECGECDVMHTGDNPRITNGNRIYVHNVPSAIKAFEYHRSKGRLLCDECYRKLKGVKQ